MRKSVLIVTVVGLLMTVGLTGAYVIAQIEPEGPVDYGPTITTDYEKLLACYSLIEDMRIEHNRQGAIARANPEKYYDTGIWQTYQDEQYKPRLKKLLAERNRLKAAILDAAYTPTEWKTICGNTTDEDLAAIELTLYGDKESEEEKPTFATSGVLTELRSVDLDDLSASALVDPVQDLSGYTEVDPNSDIAVSGSSNEIVTVTSMNREYSAYLYKDFGAAYFDGDFEHDWDGEVTDYYCTGSAWARYTNWLMANAVDDSRGLQDADEDFLESLWYFTCPAGVLTFKIYTWDGGSQTNDSTTSVSEDTQYWFTMERDEAVGAYGTFYEYIYDDSDRTSEVDTLSVTPTEKQDYRYFYVVASYYVGGAQHISGYQQNYDLDAGAAPSATPYSYGYILGGGS